MEPHRTIEGFGPLPQHRPTMPGEVGELVRAARDRGEAIYPIGGGTGLGLGYPPTRAGIALDLTGMTRVIDYPARDMTITVEAGVRIAELARILVPENQRLPIDVPDADTATVGGILATNASGPRRLGFGTLRDYLIGITVIDDAGNETHAGGRVVKNVAGYDLCKLHIGALGTLGIITAVTFKLRPLSAATALVTCSCPGEKLDGLLTRLHGSRTRPVAIEIRNGASADEWQVVVGLEESAAAVTWQAGQLVTELGPHAGQVEVTAGAAAVSVWRELVASVQSPGEVAIKANLLPSGVAEFCRTLARRAEGWSIRAHAGSGIVRGFVSGATRATVEQALREMLPIARQSAGNAIVTRCPIEWRRTLPIWGEAHGDVVVMRRIKQALDPHGIFNPGRFLDGIEKS